MMTIERDNLIQEVKAALRIEDEFRADGHDLQREGNALKCCCPFHAENTASCVVHADDQYFKCFGCGKKGDVLAYLGFKMNLPMQGPLFIGLLKEACQRAGIEFPEAKAGEPTKPKVIYSLERLRACCDFQAKENGETITQWNEYTNPDTKYVEAISVRFQRGASKRLLQATPSGDGFSFGLQGDGRKQPIFNRTRIKDAAIVVIVEGETKVRLLTKLDIVSTCNLGGSKAAKKADWAPLVGKQVLIWRDFDEPGEKWQAEVIEEMNTLGIRWGIVDVSQFAMEKGDDVCDFYERLTCEDKANAILDVLRAAIPETLESQIAADIAGTRYALKHPSFAALATTLCFLPGSITMLCASPGVSKSFLVLQWVWQMFLDGINCSALELESGDVFHWRRVLAQLAQLSEILSPEWCMRNPTLIEKAMSDHKALMDNLRNNEIIQSPRDAKITTQFLLAHIEKEAKRGRQLVAIDPVTMLETGENFWEEQKEFVRAVKRIVWKTQIRLLLVTHPKKGAEKIHMDNMAGAIAFSQNSDSVFWLEAHAPMEKAEMTSLGFDRKTYNRTLHILKSRLGPAKRPTIGYYLNGGSLLHTEVGFLEN